MREIVHVQAGQCGNQIGAKVKIYFLLFSSRDGDKHFLLYEIIVLFLIGFNPLNK